VETLEYGPFGRVVAQHRADGGAVPAAVPSRRPFGFSSKYLDTGSGLLYFGHRYYSPDLGRWLCRDPLGEKGGANLYAYCQNDPVNAVDPLGLEEADDPTRGVYPQRRDWDYAHLIVGPHAVNPESQEKLSYKDGARATYESNGGPCFTQAQIMMQLFKINRPVGENDTDLYTYRPQSFAFDVSTAGNPMTLARVHEILRHTQATVVFMLFHGRPLLDKWGRRAVSAGLVVCDSAEEGAGEDVKVAHASVKSAEEIVPPDCSQTIEAIYWLSCHSGNLGANQGYERLIRQGRRLPVCCPAGLAGNPRPFQRAIDMGREQDLAMPFRKLAFECGVGF
jgi:RHS repeat-associated protein